MNYELGTYSRRPLTNKCQGQALAFVKRTLKGSVTILTEREKP